MTRLNKLPESHESDSASAVPRSTPLLEVTNECEAAASKTTLDWNVALESVGGDRELLRYVLAAVLEECPRCLEQAEQAIQEADAELVRRAAHTIKGNLRLFGPLRAADLAQCLETIGKNGEFEKAADLLVQLRGDAELVLKEVRTFLAS